MAHGLSADEHVGRDRRPGPDRSRRAADRDVARGLPVRPADDAQRVRGQRSGCCRSSCSRPRRGCARPARSSSSCSRAATRPARAARSSGSWSTSTRAATTVVALTAPSERERGQWYFQRYVQHLPTQGRDRAVRPLLVQPGRRRAGDGVLHRRRSTRSSCARSPSSRRCSRGPAPRWSSCGSRCRGASRSPASRSAASTRCASGSSARWTWPRSTAGTTTPPPRRRCSATPTRDHAPWTVVRSNDKKRGRVEAIRFVLHRLDYPDKDHGARRLARSADRRPADGRRLRRRRAVAVVTCGAAVTVAADAALVFRRPAGVCTGGTAPPQPVPPTPRLWRPGGLAAGWW